VRILLVITRADTVGGAQLHVRDIARAYQERQHEVLVITGITGPYNQTLSEAGIANTVCPTFRNNINPIEDWQTLDFLRQKIRAFQPDLVATHSSKAGILGRWAANQTGTPCTFTAHGWSFTDGIPEPKRSIYRELEKIAERNTDRLICVSEYDRQLGIRAGMSPECLVKIHYGVGDIDPSLRARPDNSDPVRIAMVARFEPQKDHQTMLAAFKDIEGAQLDLLGDGPNMEAFQAQVEALGIGHKVNFLGFCRNVKERLARSQVFALITNWEGFPISTLEAMRAGLPTVVSDVNGCSEAILEGETGFTIPKGDVATLRDRLQQIVSDAALRGRMGRAARARYEAEYTFETMLERTLAVYERVLAERQAGKS